MSRKKVLTFGLVGLFAIAPAACGGDSADEQAELDRQMDLALSDDSATAQLADTPDGEAAPDGRPAPDADMEPDADEAPAPRTPRPSPSPEPDREEPAAAAPQPAPGPSYELVGVSAGTRLVVTLNQDLSTKTNQVGDVWSGTVLQPITDGRRVIIPAGARVVGEVTAVQHSKGSGQDAILKLSVDELSVDGHTYAMAGSIIEANPTTKGRTSTGEKAATIGGGAALGGIIGTVVGGGGAAGTVIGAAVGAAAGTAITMGTEDVDAVLASGSEMTVQVDEDFEVRWEE